MSQIYKSLTSGPVPPDVPTTFVTDIDSPAVPAANILNVFGGSVTTNNILGVQTDGSSGSNTLTIQLTNRAFGAISTIDATPTTIITFPLAAVPTVYVFDGLITAHDTTDNVGAGYFFTAAARTTGVAAVLISAPKFDTIFEEPAMAPADVDVQVSGNNLIVVVTGVAATAIDWFAQFNYTQVI